MMVTSDEEDDKNEIEPNKKKKKKSMYRIRRYDIHRSIKEWYWGCNETDKQISSGQKSYWSFNKVSFEPSSSKKI